MTTPYLHVFTLELWQVPRLLVSSVSQVWCVVDPIPYKVLICDPCWKGRATFTEKVIGTATPL
jgi:hypothetical protein